MPKKLFTSKTIILLAAVLLFPLITYGSDRIVDLLYERNMVLPLPSGDYILRVVVQACLYMLLALGLNIVPGFTGLLDLGYVGFYLVGGYTAGLLMARLGWSYWIALPLAGIHGALWGLLRGAPTLRLTGDYFAIVTFGFSELLFRIVKNEEWLIGGPNGFVNDIPAPTFFGYELYAYWQQYYHIPDLVGSYSYRCVSFAEFACWTSVGSNSRGRAGAESVGINLREYKSLAFAVSAAIGAIGGAFFAQFQVNISAGAFEFWESIFILCMIVLGGMGTIKGAVVGAGILGVLGELLRPFGGARYLIFGIILILVMRFRPAGLLSMKEQA